MQFAVAIILALTSWQVATLNMVRKDVQAFKQWAFGIAGDNGANSRIRVLEAAKEQHELEIQNLRLRLDGVMEQRRSTDHRP